MKRVSWKCGMRLTDVILRASDDNKEELIGKAFVLAANGRMGLLPSQRPFELTLNIGKGFIDVESISCLALTKGGNLIDVQYDTRYDNNFETRMIIPDMPGVEEYVLIISIFTGQWRDTSDGFEEPIYKFSLIPTDTVVPDNAMPIAHIIDDYGWRMDEVDFVPPCLFVSSHRKFEDLQRRFLDVLVLLDERARSIARSGVRNVLSVFWPLIQQLRIAAEKERELLTPMKLLSEVQKCVSAFTCACDLEESIELSDAKMYHSYVLAPYSYKEAYQRISVGVDICYSIAEKLQKLADSTPAPQSAPSPIEPAKPAAPTIADENLKVLCNTSETILPVLYNISTASIYFTTNGNNPTQQSSKATKTREGFKIKFDNGFRKENGKEASKRMTIKIVAFADGASSEISSYDVILQKDLKFRNAIPI